MLARLLEQIPHARRPHADDHLHELGRAHREERNLGLPGDRLRQQGLSGPRRADQQHALRRGSAQAGVFLGRLQEIHDLDQFVLRLVDAGHIVEGDPGARLLVVAAGLAPADVHESAHAAALLHGSPVNPDIEKNDEDRGAEAEQKRDPGTAFPNRHRADPDLVFDQERLQSGVHERGQFGGEGVRRFGLGFGQAPLVGRRVFSIFRRPGDGRRKPALDARPLAVNGLDVAPRDLFLEGGIRDGDRLAGFRKERPHQQVVDEEEDQERQPNSARCALRLFRAALRRLEARVGCRVSVARRLWCRPIHGASEDVFIVVPLGTLPHQWFDPVLRRAIVRTDGWTMCSSLR
ncbi:hypothetical protein [Methylocaldum sp. 14B]|uniref:hypothetical protein n=1 Tax=Methylocaldum sp. 14B TaxID=1912213 RepID=UPI001F0AF031|nr:hypothetical protein [Methylocaldum sp. 14B]